jgi:enoyl-CoA hydratase/carnithine racemase
LAKLDLNLDGKVAVITMDEGDNKLNLDMCDGLLAVLDRIEKETDALTLVVRSGHPHIWSNGFDLDWVTARYQAGDKESVARFLIRDMDLRIRLLSYPLITVAAFTGHVFGGAAVLSCCFDFRFMRSDRGYFCIPVVDRGYPILPGTRELLGNVLPPSLVPELILTGRRLTGLECAAYNVVAAAYPNEELMDKVMAFAVGLNKDRKIIGHMKQVINARIIQLMEEDKALLQQGDVRV